MLGYAEYGFPDGFPIIHLTGGNSSRLEGQWFSAVNNYIEEILDDLKS